jgi:8-oxo-dGTP pyrophosphatase MutT (NUDIX family)
MVPVKLEDVRAALALGPPGFDPEAAQAKISPTSRPRQRDTSLPGEPRQAATLLLLYPVEDRLHFLLTRRPESLRNHGGQIALPGGRRETNETFEQTALRETCEELAICEGITFLGALTPLYIPPSDFHVRPFVGYLPMRPSWQIDVAEVAEVFETPIDVLLDDSVKGWGTGDFRGLTFEYGWYEIKGHRVWGATAIMLSEMEGRLRQILC